MSSKLSQLTSADAVREAIAECDLLGRDPFLKKYGFQNSRDDPTRPASPAPAMMADGFATSPRSSKAVYLMADIVSLYSI
jgi:hypothetical protein